MLARSGLEAAEQALAELRASDLGDDAQAAADAFVSMAAAWADGDRARLVAVAHGLVTEALSSPS